MAVDGQRFDRMARALAARAGQNRQPGRLSRRSVLGVLGLGALAAPVARITAQPDDPAGSACAGEGEPCTLWVGCCPDLACVARGPNPNDGVCETGAEVRDEAAAIGTPGVAAILDAIPGGRTARREVGVRVTCDTGRDVVSVENRGEAEITVRSVAVTYKAGTGSGNRPGPFTLNERVGPGRSVALRFGGRGGTDRELIRAGERGVIEVRTTVGTFREECRDPERKTSAPAATSTPTPAPTATPTT